MSFRDEINKAAELVREAMAEKKEEREQLEREQKKGSAYLSVLWNRQHRCMGGRKTAGMPQLRSCFFGG